MGNRSPLEEEWTSPQFVIIWPVKASTLLLPKCSWELSLGRSQFCFPAPLLAQRAVTRHISEAEYVLQ